MQTIYFSVTQTAIFQEYNDIFMQGGVKNVSDPDQERFLK